MIDKESYIKGKGLLCPFCEAESVQGGFIEIEAGKAFQDVYELIDIISYKREG